MALEMVDTVLVAPSPQHPTRDSLCDDVVAPAAYVLVQSKRLQIPPGKRIGGNPVCEVAECRDQVYAAAAGWSAGWSANDEWHVRSGLVERALHGQAVFAVVAGKDHHGLVGEA